MANQETPSRRYNLIFVGDDIWHLDQVETWTPFLDRLKGSYPAFDYFRISNRFLSEEIYQTQDRMQKLEVILHDTNGETLWRTTGDWSPEKAESLDNVLMELTELFDDFY